MSIHKTQIIPFLFILSIFTFLNSCNKTDEKDAISMTFKVDGVPKECKTNEYVFCEQYDMQNKVFIVGSDHNNFEDKMTYEVQLLVNNVNNPQDIIGKNLSFHSPTDIDNTITEPYVNGSVYVNGLNTTPNYKDYTFTDLSVKITNVNNNRINGTFSGIIQLNNNTLTQEITEGTFSNIPIEYHEK